MDRSLYIGGSDVAAIVGLSPWRSPLDVYVEKTTNIAPQPNDAMRWGSRLEPLILAEYEASTGRKVARRSAPYVDKRHPYIVGHVDGIVRGRRGSRRVVEAKCTRAAWDTVPDYYEAQVQWYMRLARAPVADVAALIAGSELRIYEVPADAEAQRALLDAAVEFWQRHVVPRIPPPPRSEEDVRKLWSARTGKQALASPEAEAAARELRGVRAEIAALEAREQALRDRIATEMLDATELVAPDGSVLLTYAAHERSTTDWRAVTAKLAEIVGDEKVNTMIREHTHKKEVRVMRMVER